jgi:hypothetical protein
MKIFVIMEHDVLSIHCSLVESLEKEKKKKQQQQGAQIDL